VLQDLEISSSSEAVPSPLPLLNFQRLSCLPLERWKLQIFGGESKPSDLKILKISAL